MKRYKRIEITAFRRRVTIVSGEWPRDIGKQLGLPDDEVSLNDTDSCAPVTPDSPEGQLVIVEAVRSLERRLSPEARAALYEFPGTSTPQGTNRNGFHLKLQSFYQFICPKVLRFTRKEK